MRSRKRSYHKTSRKSTKKCSRSRIAVKSHKHGSKTVKSMCRKNSRKVKRGKTIKSRSRKSIKGGRSRFGLQGYIDLQKRKNVENLPIKRTQAFYYPNQSINGTGFFDFVKKGNNNMSSLPPVINNNQNSNSSSLPSVITNDERYKKCENNFLCRNALKTSWGQNLVKEIARSQGYTGSF